ncbi:Dual specificity protein phosphatase PPS1 [Neolecta irregularis DAH-3]|uniref:Dual specificity protein phosphatase PPS1 n=1 Tax=Neolecta irregularis (strain DAH-3) TaxID=1198029 RepID=A0A1U7LTT8_NEOID|nr:Dual specificity protein phosphatase PPS1 [Neolecta irregularis DAH-3]|eukprot:OLL25931.1 Dual specificity protein phosphatase PPS1 [Neolecta irregularis DAH-3]
MPTQEPKERPRMLHLHKRRLACFSAEQGLATNATPHLPPDLTVHPDFCTCSFMAAAILPSSRSTIASTAFSALKHPFSVPVTPPASPPLLLKKTVLHPPDRHPLLQASPAVRGVSASVLANAYIQSLQEPLPESNTVFPWLHGLHPHNLLQLQFLTAINTDMLNPPPVRGLTVIHVDGPGRLIMSFNPDDILQKDQDLFLDVDPVKGVGLRNFNIQHVKWATVSDIVVYGRSKNAVMAVAARLSAAQAQWKNDHNSALTYSTFVVTEPFSVFESMFPTLCGQIENGATPYKLDFFNTEREEMRILTAATSIANNVDLGNFADFELNARERRYKICIEPSDSATIPTIERLQSVLSALDGCSTVLFSFPASASIEATETHKFEGIVRSCKWLYDRATEGFKILIHCGDGYTESSLLAICYCIYAYGWCVSEAWVKLHRDLRRDFFAFPTDLRLVKALEPHLLAASPNSKEAIPHPEWFCEPFNGSFPSRILPHMYLGNLLHANNHEMLRQLGISRLLSVGEQVAWSEAEGFEVMYLDNIQDDGVDNLAPALEVALAFLDDGYRNGKITLVHCRVGVSRSASVCIAEIVRRTRISLPRAYLQARARRLNIILQPNLLLMYELLKWEEQELGKRELGWAEMAHEVAELNKVYMG